MPTARAAPSKSNKRKSDASVSGSAKKLKTAGGSHEAPRALVDAILASPEEFELPIDDEDALRRQFVELAEYAKYLEDEVRSGLAATPTKSDEQIDAEAARLANTINFGIKKQMSWKPSCKTNSAKFAFDGLCPDPLVFGKLLKLDGAPKFKAKKMSVDDFEACVGRVKGSVRYDTLNITSDVNVRWSAETGEFKVSGSYGRGY